MVSNRKKILLILDLDETLIHATSQPKDDQWNFSLEKYKVYVRPGLDKLLTGIKKYFNIAVWSSASDDYVEAIVDKIFPEDYDLKFVWARSKCTQRFLSKNLEDVGYSDHRHYSKELKKVKKSGYGTLERMLIVDDTPEKSRSNYGNAIYLHEFKGEQDDNELGLLLKYLISLKDVDNVRKIEKRFWRHEIKE